MSGALHELPPVVAGMALPEREPTLPSVEFTDKHAPIASAIWLPEGDQPGVAALVEYDAPSHKIMSPRTYVDLGYHRNAESHMPEHGDPLGKLGVFLGLRSYATAKTGNFTISPTSHREYYTAFPSPQQVNAKIDLLNEQLAKMPIADRQPLLPHMEVHHGGQYSAVDFLQSYLRGSYLLADGYGDQSKLNNLSESPAHLAMHDVITHLAGRLIQSPRYDEAARESVRQVFLDANVSPTQPWPAGKRSPQEIALCGAELDSVVVSRTLGSMAVTGRPVVEDIFFPYSRLVGLHNAPLAEALPKLREYVDESTERFYAINDAIDAIGATA